MRLTYEAELRELEPTPPDADGNRWARYEPTGRRFAWLNGHRIPWWSARLLRHWIGWRHARQTRA